MPKKHKCRICKGVKFEPVLDMGDNALVNSLIDEKDLGQTEETYPLEVVRCHDCSLVQIKNPIDSHKIYKDVDYLYFSSDMPGLKEYFNEYQADVTQRFLKPDDLVVEIGSNDGLMLSLFPLNVKILGVDPSTNVVIRALKKGIPSLPLFFEERLAKQIKAEYGEAKLIYGNNCIAHIDDLDSVLNGVKELLAPNGTFVVECNYFGGMVKNTNYALVYHDHFSYFSLQNWVDYAKKFGLEVFDALVTPAQGGSLRVFMTNGAQALTERARDLLQVEAETELNTKKVAQAYGEACLTEATKLREVVEKIKAEGKTIAGYGAAAKGFSVLKLAGIDQRHIDYFVDDSPAKQGKYTPVTHIPVIARAKVEKNPDYFFITAPNYATTIMEKEKDFLAKGGKFLLCDSTIVG